MDRRLVKEFDMLLKFMSAEDEVKRTPYFQLSRLRVV